jgi:hypothetical protein
MSNLNWPGSLLSLAAGAVMYALFNAVWYTPGLSLAVSSFALAFDSAHIVQPATTFVLYCVLAVPAALILARLRPRNALLYVLLAVVPGMCWELRFMLLGSRVTPSVLEVALVAAALPTAMLCLHLVNRRASA